MKRKSKQHEESPLKSEEDFPGYSIYPSNEDIYVQNEETELDPDDPDKLKHTIENPDQMNEQNDLLTGDDLDVPGAELDDAKEEIGSEDEENNYYSISDNR